MTDETAPVDEPEEPEEEDEPLPPPVDWLPVEGAEGLPDDVRNGDPTNPTDTYE